MMSDIYTIYSLYEAKNFDNLRDKELLECFKATSLTSCERYFLYEEIRKRAIPEKLITNGMKSDQNIKLKDSEFILFLFKGGFYSSGGLAKLNHIFIYVLFIFGPGILGMIIEEILIMKLNLLSVDYLGLSLILCLISFLNLILFFADSITNSKIVLTNYRIGIYRSFFRIIALRPRWMYLDKSIYLTNIYNLYFLPVKIFFEISNHKELLAKTQLWVSLKKLQRKSREIHFALSLEKSILLCEALFLVVHKNSGQIYNTPLKIQHPSPINKSLSLEYRFRKSGSNDFFNILKSMLCYDLPNFSSKTYYGLSNLSRLTLFAAGDANGISKSSLPIFLADGLLPQEMPLTILPVSHINPFFPKYLLLTTHRFILFNKKKNVIYKELYWQNESITTRWADMKVTFIYRERELCKVLQKAIDFPFYDVLEIAQTARED